MGVYTAGFGSCLPTVVLLGMLLMVTIYYYDVSAAVEVGDEG